MNFKQAFNNGQTCWRNQDYINARYWYEIAMQQEEYREKSILKLIQVEIKEGKYAKARQMLNDNKDLNSVALKQVYGLLENIENNFKASRRYYSECMIDSSMQYKSLLALAKLHIQTGDNQIARKMFETLQLNINFNILSTLGLICLEIFEENYDDAYRLLQTLNPNSLTPKICQHYRIIDSFLKSKLGILRKFESSIDPNKNYMLYRLYDNSDKVLLSHVGRHLNQDIRQSYGCFFKYIDLKKLLIDVRDKIFDMNANHFEISDMYRFKLDTPIGFKGDDITSDICVVTMIGTKDIITIYPIKLSEQFDIEGMSTSKELALKRKQGGIKIDK